MPSLAPLKKHIRRLSSHEHAQRSQEEVDDATQVQPATRQSVVALRTPRGPETPDLDEIADIVSEADNDHNGDDSSSSDIGARDSTSRTESTSASERREKMGLSESSSDMFTSSTASTVSKSSVEGGIYDDVVTFDDLGSSTSIQRETKDTERDAERDAESDAEAEDEGDTGDRRKIKLSREQLNEPCHDPMLALQMEGGYGLSFDHGMASDCELGLSSGDASDDDPSADDWASQKVSRETSNSRDEEDSLEQLKASGGFEGYFMHGGYGVVASDSDGDDEEPAFLAHGLRGYKMQRISDSPVGESNSSSGYLPGEGAAKGYLPGGLDEGEDSDDGVDLTGAPGYNPGGTSEHSSMAYHPAEDDSESAPDGYGAVVYGLGDSRNTVSDSSSGSIVASPAQESSPSSTRYGAVAYGISSDADDSSPLSAETTLYSLKEMGKKKKEKRKAAKRPTFAAAPGTSGPPSPTVKLTGGANWNVRFQNILDEEDSYEKYDELCNLAKDFAYCAKTYGRIIISEVQLPEEHKTIPPMQFGGVAGGAKYLCQGILFKFCRDTIITPPKVRPAIWMYGGSKPDTHAAMKAAAHDLKGLVNCYSTKIPKLHFPLMAIIDYRGYRLVAVSVLPISKKTLVYGSADGGKSVFAKDTTFNSMMENMGKQLRMKRHRVAANLHVHDDESKAGEPVCLYGPADIEGHKGSDGRFYMIDFARCSPPESTSVSKTPNRRAIFYHLLRPEFLRLYGKDLSCDAFSGFDPSAKNRCELHEAARHLHDKCIPAFVSLVQGKFISPDEEVDSFSLIEELHRAGLNVRHLGRIRALCNDDRAKAYLMAEIVARTLKNMLNALLRKINLEEGVPLVQPYKKAVVDFLNMIVDADGVALPQRRRKKSLEKTLAMSMESNKSVESLDSESTSEANVVALSPFWCNPSTDEGIKQNIHKFYAGALSELELGEAFDLRCQFHGENVLKRLFALVNLKVSARAAEEIQGVEVIVPGNLTFFRSDVLDLEECVKDLNVIAEAEANTLVEDAMSYKGANPDVLWKMVNRSLKKAVASMPSSFELLRKWGEALCVQARFQDGKNAEAFYDQAAQKLRQALTINPEHVPSLALLGEAYLEHGCLFIYGSIHQVMLLSSAQRYTKKALSLDDSVRMRLAETAMKLYDSVVDARLSNEFVNRPEEWRAKQFNKLVRSKTLLEAIVTSRVTLTATEMANYLYHLALSLMMIITYARSNSSSIEALLWQTAHRLDSAMLRLPYEYLTDVRNIYFCETNILKRKRVRGFRVRGRQVSPLLPPAQEEELKPVMKHKLTLSGSMTSIDMHIKSNRRSSKGKLLGTLRGKSGSRGESFDSSSSESSPSSSGSFIGSRQSRASSQFSYTGQSSGQDEQQLEYVLKETKAQPTPLWLKQTKEGRAGNQSSWNQQMEVTCMLIPDSSRCKIIGKNTSIVLAYQQDLFCLTEVVFRLFSKNEISGLDYQSPSKVEVFLSSTRPTLIEKEEDGMTVIRPEDEKLLNKVCSFRIPEDNNETEMRHKVSVPVHGSFLTISVHKRCENDAVFKHIGFRGHHCETLDKIELDADDSDEDVKLLTKHLQITPKDRLSPAAAVKMQKRFGLFKQVVQDPGREQLAVVIRLCEYSYSLRVLFSAHLEQLSLPEAAREKHNYHQLDFMSSPYVNDFALQILSANCRGLTKLHLYGCKQFSDNGLQSILENCSLLTTLDLRGCRQLTDVTVNNLALTCEKYARLSTLSLWAQVSTFLEKTPSSTLKKFACVRLLDLTANAAMTDKILISFVRQCRSLETLNLSFCTGITDKSMVNVAQYLQESLHRLIANGCPGITNKGIAALHTKTCCTKLKELQIGSDTAEMRHKHNPLPPMLENSLTNVTDDSISQLTKRLGGRLRHLNLKRNTALTDSSISGLFTTCRQLEYLDISYIHKAASSVLYSVLNNSGLAMFSLRHLHMGHTRASSAILKILADSNEGLESLSIDCCHQVTEIGMLEAVAILKNLTVLSVSGIEAISEKVISHTVATIPKLRVFNVSNCSQISLRFVDQMQRSCPSLRLYFQPSSKCCRPLCELE